MPLVDYWFVILVCTIVKCIKRSPETFLNIYIGFVAGDEEGGRTVESSTGL